MTALPRIGPRQLLITLSLAGIVPLAIVATVLLVALGRSQQAELHDAFRSTAQALAASVEQRVDATVQRLRLLAMLENPQAGPEAKDVVMVPASAEPLPPHRRKVFQGEVAVSDLFLVPGRDAHIEVGVPALREGKVAHGLFTSFDAQELSALLRQRLRDPSGVASIVDGQYRVVARSRDPAAYVGKPLVAPLDAAVRSSPSGLGRFPVHDGPDVYSAWTRIAGTRWTLILGTSAAPADAALSRSLGALAALLVIALIASGLFIWLIGRRVADAMHSAADTPTKGDEAQTQAPPPRVDRERELGLLLEEEQRARQHAETANRAKDEFLAMLGHELRNPLGAIRNAVRVIDRLPPTSADHKSARDIVGRQTAHLARIVDDLLDVGRVVSGRILLRRNLVDLAHATAAAVAAVRAGEEGSGHEWELELQSVLVSADPTRIDQVLANLVGNAAKFTPAGGRISVRLSGQGGGAVLVIEDSGPGIKRELLPHVFDLFTKDPGAAEHGGLGIGLTLVRRLVELHGGSVNAENREDGAGARFTLRLPAIPEPEPQAPRDARPLPVPRPARQARVLIVEDNDDSRVTLQRILQADGHLVSAARDARAGLEAAIAGSPNVAVVDIGLPGMDGYEFARAVRERLGSGVRLIALTGYGSESDRQRSAQAGFDAHLTKPVDLDRLLALITEAGT